MALKFGIVVFPGSNCDHDAYSAVKKDLNCEAEFLWHKEKDLKSCDIIILPGGFSYGDYLRSGAIARFSPIMEEVIKFANKGGKVIGICNGFQILVESGLLPGVLLKNNSLQFICKDVYLSVQNRTSIYTKDVPNKPIKIPIAHGEGNYFADDDTIRYLNDNNLIAFKYCDEDGNVDNASNPNGSIQNIAGIINKDGNVLGMMPHPERACSNILGKSDGRFVFDSIINNFE